MSGPCAKRVVTCVILSYDNIEFVGTNYCENPQEVCPREPGEGYEKCKSICKQVGHAEEVALKEAGKNAKYGIAYIDHEHYCRDCQHKLFDAGVLYLSKIETLKKIK